MSSRAWNKRPGWSLAPVAPALVALVAALAALAACGSPRTRPQPAAPPPPAPARATPASPPPPAAPTPARPAGAARSEEHTSELQSRGHLVCRLLLEKRKS